MQEDKQQGITLNQETMDVLVANIIPTTKYFETRFDFMQHQIDEIKANQKSMQSDMDRRFEQVDKRFEQVDKRFEQVDKRFEQVDKRFEQVNKNIMDLSFEIKNLSKTMEVTIRDHIIDRDRHYDSKFNQLRMFNIATISLVAGIILKMAGIINI